MGVFDSFRRKPEPQAEFSPHRGYYATHDGLDYEDWDNRLGRLDDALAAEEKKRQGKRLISFQEKLLSALSRDARSPPLTCPITALLTSSYRETGRAHIRRANFKRSPNDRPRPSPSVPLLSLSSV